MFIGDEKCLYRKSQIIAVTIKENSSKLNKKYDTSASKKINTTQNINNLKLETGIYSIIL